jgi:assimilatory nitrate reductase catalytic subunit
MNPHPPGDSCVVETRSVCCYCGTGCGVIIEQREGRIVGVRGDPDHPANGGRLCSKGSTLHLTAGPAGRALYPEARRARGERRVRVEWGDALDLASERFAEIIGRHGPDAVAFYVSGQLLTEDYYVFNKLARGLVGTNNIDSNSRLCMSSAVAGYKATLGADSVPACYEDIELADHLLIAGSNTAWAHPVLFRRIEEARRRNPGLSITVVDPRRTETAEFADLHLMIAPGTDVLLFNAMLHVLLWEDRIDRDFIREHTSGFEALRDRLADYAPGSVACACGVPADRIVEAARRFGEARAVLSLWCQGLNQSHHGVANNAALIHLHLATGQIGRPGAGPLSLTGQPNAMGGREVGAMASLLPGHRDPAVAADRDEVAQAWGGASLPSGRGLSAIELFDALGDGSVRAVWIACTNPAHSLPHQAKVRAALERAEFVVVQEAYADTETADFADVLLPAASWGEKSGTMTNSERRIARVRAAVPPPGEARADWRIAAEFAGRLGLRLGVPTTGFDFADEAAVFAEHVSLTAGRDCDQSGLSHARLDALGPQQWPCPSSGTGGSARLFGDGRFATTDGRARFSLLAVPTRHAPLPEPVDARHPFVLLTGRLRDQWHGMSRSGKVERLRSHSPQPRVHLNPVDLDRRGWREGMLLRLFNRRGAVVVPVAADAAIAPGQAWLPMHWGSATLAQPGANAVSTSVLDPVSGQPALKGAAVSIATFEAGWQGAWASVALGTEQAFARMAALRPLLERFDHAVLAVTGHDRPVVTLLVASAEPPDKALLQAVDTGFGTGAQASLAFADECRGVCKRARVEGSRLQAIRLAGETAAFGWLVEAMQQDEPIHRIRPWLFAPIDRIPGTPPPAGRVVCSCHGVTEDRIRAVISSGGDLAALEDRLKCGTACGSCVPELRRLLSASVRSVMPVA